MLFFFLPVTQNHLLCSSFKLQYFVIRMKSVFSFSFHKFAWVILVLYFCGSKSFFRFQYKTSLNVVFFKGLISGSCKTVMLCRAQFLISIINVHYTVINVLFLIISNKKKKTCHPYAKEQKLKTDHQLTRDLQQQTTRLPEPTHDCSPQYVQYAACLLEIRHKVRPVSINI